MSQLLDYSFSRPAPSVIKRAGYLGVMRYLSPGGAKNLTTGERDGLLAAGLGIGLVWESSGNRAAQGYAAGLADASAANAHADALGHPRTHPIFYAVDYAANPAAVAPYFQGAVAAGGRPVGVYGSYAVVEGVAVPYRWQTAAWSSGRISGRAHLYQRVGGSTIAGTDANDLRQCFPLWGIDPAPVPVPTPPAPVSQEDDMLDLVLWCYTWLVGRTVPPSTDEVANWLSGTDGWTSAHLLAAFERSRAEPGSVVRAYWDYLGRAPEDDNVIAGHLTPPVTIAALRYEIATSPEAKARAGQ